ncbi:hypothetical protein AYO47_08680 [Planctomyces sp. SCGC AG-212-M04]|nr:hypothetical protein AYO47_08680 [Planctomyces sp. SCGC AG-212-M04]
MLEYAYLGRRIGIRSVDEVLARSLQSRMDSQALLRIVANGDSSQRKSTAYSQDVIRQCRVACAQATRHLNRGPR